MSQRMDDLFAKITLWIQLLLIGVFVLEFRGLITIAHLGYLATLPIIMVLTTTRKHIVLRDKVLISLSAAFVLFANLFTMHHWSGADIFQVFSLLSIITLFLFMFKGSNDWYNEIGILFLLAVVSGYGCIHFFVLR